MSSNRSLKIQSQHLENDTELQQRNSFIESCSVQSEDSDNEQLDIKFSQRTKLRHSI